MNAKYIDYVAIYWLVGGVAFAPAPGGPHVVQVTDAQPGHVMIVSGGGYDPKTVRAIVHVPGTTTAQREELPKMIGVLAESYDGSLVLPPPQPPTKQTHALTPLLDARRFIPNCSTS